MKRQKRRARAGFTLVEIITVLVIIAILAAIAVPSIFAFLEAGRQTNRMSIARTLYLAAQSRFTEMRITRELEKSYGAEDFIFANGGGQVIAEDGMDEDKFLEEDEENKENIYYISKPRWTDPGDYDPSDPVYSLLNPVIISKEILDDAILIEYNIKTGVVMSVFYSDMANVTEFEYLGTAPSARIENDVSDSRPYTAHDLRKQGYYGVGNTGSLDDPLPELFISLYDGATRPMPSIPSNNTFNIENVLYAQISISETINLSDLVLTIHGNVNGISEEIGPFGFSHLHIHSLDDSTPYAEKRKSYIWIIDYVNGNTNSSDSFTDITKRFDPTSVYVTLKLTDPLSVIEPVDSNEQLPYFLAQSADALTYSIKTARHLYDIRYALTYNFIQADDIPLHERHEVTNFVPIIGPGGEPFTGSYNGAKKYISGLDVSVPVGSGNTGLFGTIDGEVKNLTLEAPTVANGNYAGALCGMLNGTASSITVNAPSVSVGTYAGGVAGSISITGEAAEIMVFNPAVSGGISGGVCGTLTNGNIENVYIRFDYSTEFITGTTGGGLVGLMESGTLANATFISPFPVVHVSGGAAGGIVGAVVDGEDVSVLENILFLALAPINGDGEICPIVGIGTLDDDETAYYLSGKPVRPDEAALPDGYNLGNSSVGVPKSTYELYELSASLSWMRKQNGVVPLTLSDVVTLEADGLHLVTPIYPYPFINQWNTSGSLPSDPYWPIAEEEDEADVTFVYYELYDDGTWGFRASPDSEESIDDLYDKLVVHDGYGIKIKDVKSGNSYILKLGGYEAALTVGDGTVASSDGKWTAWWFEDNGDEKDLFLCIPNAIAEEEAVNSIADSHIMNGRVGIELKKGSASLLDEVYNPLFAAFSSPETGGIVRSPRHISDISEIINEATHTYTQELVIDFKKYRRELASVTMSGVDPQGNVDAASDGLASLDTAVVGFGMKGYPVPFFGKYNGNDLEIRNVNIVSESSQIGLFWMNYGTIENVAMVGTRIKGTDSYYVGGVVGDNFGEIVNITMTDTEISGGSSVGGVVGRNSNGELVNITMADTKIIGTYNSVGGVSGYNLDAIIENVKMTDTYISGTYHVGGVAGYLDNFITVDGKIKNVEMAGSHINGEQQIGGVTGFNGCTLLDVTVRNSSVSGTGEYVGGVAGVSRGTINDVTITDLMVEGDDDNVGGVAGMSSGADTDIVEITDVEITDAFISGRINVGGVVGVSSGHVEHVTTNKLTVTGIITITIPGTGSCVGGVAGQNSGTIEDATMTDPVITGYDDVGGVVGLNYTAISTVYIAELTRPTVTGRNNVGGVAGSNDGIIGATEDAATTDNIVITDASINGSSNVGGIAGLNASTASTVVNSKVTNATITGSGDNVGGVAGSNSGTVHTVTVDNPAIAGKDNIGGIAGANSGTIHKATVDDSTIDGINNVGGAVGENNGTVGVVAGAVAGNNVVITGIDISGNSNVGGIAGVNNSGKTVSNSRVIAAAIDGGSYVGGIAGSNAGAVTRSFIGMQSGNENKNAYNEVLGDDRVGGIAGSSSGTISNCYVDFTWVGRDAEDEEDEEDEEGDGNKGAENVGGVVGYMGGGAVSNVYYNYGTAIAQRHPYRQTILGDPASTGGLVGHHQAGTLSNAYTDAYFESDTPNLVRGSGSGSVSNSNVLYLKQVGYNSNATSSVGTAQTAAELRADAAVTALGEANWMRGSGPPIPNGNNPDNPQTYTYPRLLAFSGTAYAEPKWWPLPHPYALNIAYYELYENPNPYNGGKHYGLWQGPGEDTLDYTPGQKVIEDGYVLLTENAAWGANNLRYWAMSMNRNAEVDLGGIQIPSTIPYIHALERIGLVFPLSTAETFASGLNGLYPVEVIVTRGGSTNSTKEIEGIFFNPLFAKAIYHDRSAAEAFDPLTAGHIIRTPRQLNNIGRFTETRAGVFKQEIDIDFSGLNTSAGYWRNNRVDSYSSLGPNDHTPYAPSIVDGKFDWSGRSGTNRTTIDIKNSIVSGTFTGRYYGVDDYFTPTIRNIGATTDPNGKATNGGGIFSQIGAGGAVRNLILQNNTVGGAAGPVGGLAGTNGGKIEKITSVDCTVAASSGAAGGIAGANTGEITNIKVEEITVTGGVNTGGVAGSNTDTVELCQVINATVTGTSHVGGIVGANSGTLQDSFFLSTADPDAPPVGGASYVGGIAGTTSTVIARALYLAPAPTVTSEGKEYYYPIRGNTDEDTMPEHCFYLYGSSYTLAGEKGAGADWKEGAYNRPIDPSMGPDDPSLVQGGGTRLYTSFLDIPFIEEMLYEERVLTGVGGNGHWEQGDVMYPYPMLKTMTGAPKHWPETDGPARADQLNYTKWETEYSRNSVGVVDFINGDFDLPLMNPGTKAEIPLLGGSGNGGWNTSVGSFLGLSRNEQWGWFWIYHHQEWVQGWNTRPVNPADYDNPPGSGNEYWYAVEFQRPSSGDSMAQEGRARRDYKGGSTGIYAELNADVSGTLYQICNTVPNTQTYYSFYHTARSTYNNNSTNFDADKMTFYLSGMVPSGSSTGGFAYADGSGRPTVLRPCITPRNQSTGTTATNIPVARRTVIYGTITPTSSNSAKTITPARVDFYDPVTGTMRNAFLCDVWVSGLGYGITYWADTNIFGTIPAGGVANVGALPGYSENRVIGYWHVADFGSGTPRYSEWKQYYGLYTIPEGQTITEFAFESNNTANPQHGNYLAGVSFKAPGFVTVDKYIKTQNGENAKFVKPGEILTVELHLRNYGEVAVDNIVITDPIVPYNAYIAYVNSAGSSYNESSGVVTINVGGSLAPGASTIVRFNIRVRDTLYDSATTARTLQYYFRNQASVRYFDATTDYSGSRAPYTDKVETRAKYNASAPENGAVQVFIDPVKLTKTITPEKDGPFTVTIELEDTTTAGTTVDAKGMLTITLPPGFVTTKLPDGAVLTPIAGGFTRIVVSDVHLTDPDVKSLVYQYELEYKGSNFGMAFDSVTANYRYIFFDTVVGGAKSDPVPVLLEAEKTVVGLSVQAKTLSFDLNAADLVAEDSGAPGSMIYENFLEGFFTDNMIDEGGYLLRPEVILWEDANTRAKKNANGRYELIVNGHVIELLQETGNICTLYVTPSPSGGPDADGDYDYDDDWIEILYSIELIAEKPGSGDINLSSGTAPITIDITGTQSGGLPDPCDCDDECGCDDNCLCALCPDCDCADDPDPCECDGDCDCDGCPDGDCECDICDICTKCECECDCEPCDDAACDCVDCGVDCDCDIDCDCVGCEGNQHHTMSPSALLAGGLPIVLVGKRQIIYRRGALRAKKK